MQKEQGTNPTEGYSSCCSSPVSLVMMPTWIAVCEENLFFFFFFNSSALHASNRFQDVQSSLLFFEQYLHRAACPVKYYQCANLRSQESEQPDSAAVKSVSTLTRSRFQVCNQEIRQNQQFYFHLISSELRFLISVHSFCLRQPNCAILFTTESGGITRLVVLVHLPGGWSH